MSVCVQSTLKSWLGSRFGLALFLVVGAVSSGIALGHMASRSGSTPDVSTAKIAPVKKTAVLQDSTWLSESYWRRKKQRKLSGNNFGGRSNLGFNPFSSGQFRKKKTPKNFGGGNYRTVCVRLCDGYYFPVSFSTSQSRFAQDEQACRSRCSSESRLFYYNNSGGSPETMIDLRGRAYAKLKSAFLYRTKFSKSCQCRPDPWSNAAKQRHAMYATKDWQRNARRLAKKQRKNAKLARTGRSVVTPYSFTVRHATQPPLVFGQLASGSFRTSARRNSYVRRARKPAKIRRSRARRSRSWKSKIFNN